jgi:hypothetical protein
MRDDSTRFAVSTAWKNRTKAIEASSSFEIPNTPAEPGNGEELGDKGETTVKPGIADGFGVAVAYVSVGAGVDVGGGRA